MRHVYDCPMRWADLDQLGHVNNVVYLDYLQEARVDMLRSHGRRAAGEELTEGVVVARHEITYMAPMPFRFRPVRIECWVTEIRAATFTMAYEVFHDGEGGVRTVYLRATSVLAPYMFATEQPRRLTAEERASLHDYLEPAETAPARGRRRPPPVPRTDVGHYPLTTRFSDVDVYGHVNNVKYLEYLQESRIRWFAAATRDLEAGPARFVVAQTEVDYRSPILFRPEPYDVWTTIERLGTRSMTLRSEICDGETVLALARITTVFYDLDAGRSVEPDPAVRARLEQLTPGC